MPSFERVDRLKYRFQSRVPHHGWQLQNWQSYSPGKSKKPDKFKNHYKALPAKRNGRPTPRCLIDVSGQLYGILIATQVTHPQHSGSCPDGRTRVIVTNGWDDRHRGVCLISSDAFIAEGPTFNEERKRAQPFRSVAQAARHPALKLY